MELREFVEETMRNNNIDEDIDKVVELICDQAQKKAKDNCAYLSDEDVENIVLNSHQLLEDKEETEKKTTQVVKTTKPKTTTKPSTVKKVEKPFKETKSEQISLDGLELF